MNSQDIGSRIRSSGASIFLLLLCLLLGFAPTGVANPVTIQDASFDSRALTVGGRVYTLTPWQETGSIGNTNGWIERVSGFAADSQNYLGVNSGHSVWQDLAVTYHYRSVATTGGATIYGSGETFTTAQPAQLALTPPIVAIAVPSGESAGGNLTVQNSGLGAGGWSLEVVDAKGRGDNMAGALAAISASGTSLNGPLPDRFDFSQGETGTAISDGGGGGTSLFSNGNQLSTSLGGPIAYSDGVVSTAATLGTGGNYFTKKLPGLFIFGADLNGPSWFEVNGSITYGTGLRQTSEFSVTRNGRRWSAFVAKMPDYWRTINHLILVDQGGLTATTGTSTRDQKHRISGLTGKRKVFHLLYVTSTSGIQPDSVFEDLAGRLLDAVPLPFSSVFAAVPATGITDVGGNSPVTLTANALGIAPGSYPFQVRGTSETGSIFGSAQGSLEVTAPRLVLPSEIFRAGPVGLAPFVVDVPITSNDSMPQSWNATLSDSPGWLALDTPSGTTPSSLKLRFAPGSLAPGNYSTTLRITSNGVVFEIPVRLTVSPLSIRKFLPDPRRPVVYAVNQNGYDAGELLEISTISKTITRAVRVGKEPSDFDVSEDGSKIWVINSKDPSIMAVSTVTWQVIETIPLTGFSSRSRASTEPGAHIKCGKGSIIYYVDEQWGPRLRVFDTATRILLQTFSAESGITPDTSNNYGYGDIALNPQRTMLFGWRQYGDGAGAGGSHIVRFDIKADGKLEKFTRSTDYYSANFDRAPYDTPVLFSRDGSRLVIKDRVVDRNSLGVHPIVYPDEIYSISPGGEIAVGSTAIYAGEGGEILHNLPVTSNVQAVLPDYSSLVYFNATAKSLGWIDLPTTLGNARLGLELTPADGSTVALPSRLKWLPITGITRYQVYLGTSRSEVENATTSSPLYSGVANGNEMALAAGLTVGQTYHWRVVPLGAGDAPVGAGSVYSFSVSNMTFSRSSIAAETVQGVTTHVETIQLESTVPQAWTATESTAWIKSVTAAGTTPGTLTIVMDASGLIAGNYQGSVTVTSAGSQVVVPVSLRVYAANFVIADADLDLPYIYLISQADVSSTQPSFLLRLNTATDKIESALRCGSGVTDLAVHYLENRIYLTNWKTGVLRAYDRTTFAQVQTYQFAPVGATGYGEGGLWRISAGKEGRLITEESDQWIDIRLINTVNGAVLATQSSEYAGDGEADPLGRYYYHSDSDNVTRYDLSADTFVPIQPNGSSSARTVVMIPDGSRIAAGAKVFDSSLVLQFTLPAEVLAATLHGDLLFTSNKAYNGVTGLEQATLPANTTVMSVSGDQKKLYQFPTNSAAFQAVALSTIATLPSRSLTPAIATGATVIGTTQELGWSIEPVALSYDVYFGTSAAALAAATKTSPQFLGNTSSSRWTGSMPPLGLASDYFWRVDVVAFSGTTKGDVWSFRVAPLGVEPKKLSVVLPANSPAQTVDLQVGGPAGATWTVSESTSWLTMPSTAGVVPGVQKVTINPAGMAAGIYSGSVRFQSGSDSWDFPVSLEVIALNYTHATADLDLSRIYAISQPGSGTDDRAFLVVFDTATNQVLKVVPVGRSVTSVSVHYQENRLYLTNWASGVLRALDRTTLQEVKTYQFSPAGATGYGSGDAYVVAAGRSGRIMVKGQEQRVDSLLVDTATGNKLATFSSREGGGLFEPTGRYYFHGENNSSGPMIGKYDTNSDKITLATSKRVESYSYYGSRLVAMSGDGSRVFWNGGVFDSNLNVLMQLKEEVISSTYRGELIFTNTKAINGSNSQTLATLPVDTKVQAVSGDQRKLFLFKNAAVSVVDINTLASVPPRGLVPGIASGSTVIGTSQELTWSQEAAALSYDVYFGTKSAVTDATKTSSAFLGSVTGTRWNGILPELALGGQYYWRVDINGFSSVTKGNVWLFQIAPVDVVPRAVKLTAPAGSPVSRQNLAITAGAATAWTAATTTPWISLRSTAGSTPGALEFDINTTGLTVGTKNGSITLQAAGKSFTVPVELSVVTLNVTKLITHPNRPVVYAINTSLTGEGFCHLLEINSATAAIQRTLPIGFAPTDADLNPVNERLYISNWGYSQTRVIDVAAWAELPALNLGEDIYKLEVTPDSRLVTEGQDQWIQLNVWNAVNGNNLASSSKPYFHVREGDGQADPTGAFYYHCDNNSSGAIVQKFDIASNSFVQKLLGPQIGGGSRNLILSGDGKRLFWLGRTLDENLKTLATMPSNAEVHATNHTGEIAIGESAVWWSDSGTQLATLPFAGTVATVSSNDAYLVRFNATTRTLHSTAVASLTDLPGPNPRPGQILNESPQRLSWSPVSGATSYRVFIAADATALQAMTAPTATVVTNFYDLPAPLVSGRAYSWRVDAVKDSGVVAGKVQSFIVRFPQGPQLAMTRNNSRATAVSLAQGKLLLGWGDYSSGAQVFDFDAVTGSTRAIQSFVLAGYYGDHYFGSSVAVDQETSFVGAYARDNPADGGGNVFAYRPGPGGYWEQKDIQAPPAPVAAESFGKGIAAAGNLMLAGTGNIYSLTGRVAAYLTEPSVVRAQVFSASDGAIGDGFGSVIAMDGNRTIISAPGRGSSYNRIPCLYSFTRSTSTGLWSQTQKITIPGATSSSNSGIALALSGTTMAVNVNSTAVAIFTESGTNQWTHSVTINSSTVAGASSSFGVSLALHGDQLFIGDPNATHVGTSGGAVFSFRRNGTAWVAGPVIIPVAARSYFGRGIAVREGWLVVTGDTDSRPASVFRIEQAPNRIPWFANGVASQLVAGRAFSIPLAAADADGNAGLTLTKLSGPSWLGLTDQGNGAGLLSGTPVGASGSTHDAQFEVRDGKGGRSLWTTRITLLAPTDLPKLIQEPAAADLGVGREFVLRAAVSGIGPFQWQWYLDGKAISGATRDTLVIGEVKDTDTGRYQVRVSNVVGEVASSEVVLAVHPANRYGGDWPTFGGSPSHTGRHPAALDSTQFLPAWSRTIQTGKLLNRAAIADGRAVVVPKGYFASDLAAKGLDLKTGEVLWSFPFPSSYSSNPPSLHNGRVYFQRGKGTGDIPQLFCLDATTGSQIWASTFSAQWESYEAPAISDQGIYVNGGSYGGMYGYGLDGSQKFFVSLAQQDGWTPTLSGGRLFTCVGGNFTEHNPNDGTELWSIPVNAGPTVSAIQGDNAVVIGTGVTCVSLTSRTVQWTVAGSFTGTPAIADGRVFAIQGNAVRSYALANGAPGRVYQTTIGNSYNEYLLDQPILFNDRLAISSQAKTWIFNLEDGKLLQTLDGGGRLSYSNGYLLAAGNDGTLRAFAALNFNPKIASLKLGSGGYLPEFDSLTTRYLATVPFDTSTLTITPTTQYPDATVKINGVPEANGSASRQLVLNVGENSLQTLVTAEDGITTMTYTVVVTRLPQNFVFNSATDIPLTANGFLTGNFPVNIVLNYPPVPGTTLTMLQNTGLGFINGRFSNLAQGQRVWLSHAGKNYPFAVNYHGGTGNDLVLQWAGTRVAAWGLNNYGQLGDGTNTQQLAPIAINDTGVLAGKTIFAISTGNVHSVALCSDGTLASWGYNIQGQLGDNGSTNQSVPVTVDRSGVLAGKAVVAIASGSYHNLALCSDGTVAAWGLNNHGQLGDGTKTSARTPVLVKTDGVLAGKQVVAVAAGAYQSYALCSDGSIAAWGYNDEGELGNGGITGTPIPVAVALSDKKVATIAAGQYHTLALCTDGTLLAWGYNPRGQLGNSSTADSKSPVAISSFGALKGKSVKAIAAGSSHSLALCTDGTLAAWGLNSQNQLGATGIAQSTTPVVVTPPARTLAALAAGAHHNLLRFTDGGVAAWGANASGQLGSNGTQSGAAPVNVDTSALDHGGFIMFAASGCASSHNLAVFAVPVDLPVGLEAWRLENFADMGVGNPLASDCADCDHDGIPNLVEYAFGLDPQQNSGGQIPVPQRVGNRLELRFSREHTAPDIEYAVEWSPDLRPGSWREVPDSGSGGEYFFTIPFDTAPCLFMRHRVKKAQTSQ